MKITIINEKLLTYIKIDNQSFARGHLKDNPTRRQTTQLRIISEICRVGNAHHYHIWWAWVADCSKDNSKIYGSQNH